jgi:hypothetical protein
MDSNTVLTLENTDEAIKRSQNYVQRQDNDGEKHVAFSSASDESNDGEEVKALRAALFFFKEKSPVSVGTRGQVRQLLKRAKGRQQQAQEAGEEE